MDICTLKSKEMNAQDQLNYHRIAEAIIYLQTHFKEQPNLDEVAEAIHLSPFYFQRLFSEWAGTTPKKFLQYISLEHAKKLLVKDRATLFDTAFETGLSSTSRLHDLFVKIEGMTPAEYKNGGENLRINYRFAESPFGNLMVASTTKGICYMAFEDQEEKALKDIKRKFPKADFVRKPDRKQQEALFIFQGDWSRLSGIKLHLKGTDFQLRVWEALLKIPMGRVSTYGAIAREIGNPRASRAVGTAISRNPVAFLIPCHRVIRATGMFGGYQWGSARKTAMIGWESAKIEFEK